MPGSPRWFLGTCVSTNTHTYPRPNTSTRATACTRGLPALPHVCGATHGIPSREIGAAWRAVSTLIFSLVVRAATRLCTRSSTDNDALQKVYPRAADPLHARLIPGLGFGAAGPALATTAHQTMPPPNMVLVECHVNVFEIIWE